MHRLLVFVAGLGQTVEKNDQHMIIDGEVWSTLPSHVDSVSMASYHSDTESEKVTA